MRRAETDAITEGTFHRRLHDEVPADPRAMAMSRDREASHAPLGHGGRVRFDEPVERSPSGGEHLMATRRARIHGHGHLVGSPPGLGRITRRRPS
jgi:hypothetical protein